MKACCWILIIHKCAELVHYLVEKDYFRFLSKADVWVWDVHWHIYQTIQNLSDLKKDNFGKYIHVSKLYHVPLQGICVCSKDTMRRKLSGPWERFLDLGCWQAPKKGVLQECCSCLFSIFLIVLGFIKNYTLMFFFPRGLKTVYFSFFFVCLCSKFILGSLR